MEYIVITVILLILLLAYLKLASRFHIRDIPNGRSSHTQVTLNGGGIIFYAGVLCTFLGNGFQYPYFFIGLTLITIVSFADDISSVSESLRLLVHFVAVAFLFIQLKMYNVSWYTFFFFSFVYVGFVNIYNFMDGINGMTVGYSLTAIGSFWYVNNYLHTFTDNSFLYVIALSLGLLIPFNFRKRAICFVGDVGAVSMAFILLFLLVKLILATADFSYFILFAVYGVDGVLTIVHRLLLKENILKAHRKHVYQILVNELKISHVRVALFYLVLQALIFIGYIGLRSYKYWYFGGVIVVLSGAYVRFIGKYYKYTAPDKY